MWTLEVPLEKGSLMIDWIQQNSSLINAIATITLVSVTGYYAYLTRRILEASERQSKLSLDPVVGIEIENIGISKIFGPNRRNMSVGLKLKNVGNALAIEILVDAEIELRYSEIKSQKIIPSRFDPYMIPFLRPGESTDKCHPNFGNKLIAHFFDDVRESSRLNLHRIETDPTKESFRTSKLKVFAYYRNSLGQQFKSKYEIEIGMRSAIPKDDEKAEVTMTYIPRPIFHAGPIQLTEKEEEIRARDANRQLCGW